MNTTKINQTTARREFTPVDLFDWDANRMDHRTLTCTHHMDKRWITKDIRDRSLHFLPNGAERECRCPISDLRVIG